MSHDHMNSSSVSIVNGYGLEEQDMVPQRDMNLHDGCFISEITYLTCLVAYEKHCLSSFHV
jgi:hypothetical protein